MLLVLQQPELLQQLEIKDIAATKLVFSTQKLLKHQQELHLILKSSTSGPAQPSSPVVGLQMVHTLLILELN
jgi:hypothetical protein